jgi:hypothetical protein
MQYKRLSIDELQSLETDFVRFLSLQGIDAPQWQIIKQSDQARCDQLIEEFSDLVIGSTLEKIQYLMKSEDDNLYLFEMKNDVAHVYIFKIRSEINTVADINSYSSTFISSGRKVYMEDRSAEIYKMLESGCSICTTDVYNAFMQMIN